MYLWEQRDSALTNPHRDTTDPNSLLGRVVGKHVLWIYLMEINAN
jgi:hypothetical protein